MPTAEIVPTTIAKSMTAMLRDTHQRRSIAIFAGPPGIGKTTAVQAFADEHAGSVVVVKIERSGKQGVVSRMLMQEIILAIWKLRGTSSMHVYLDTYQVKQQLAQVVKDWAQSLVDNRLWSGLDWQKDGPKLTLIIDEAQNLSRDAIDTLRYWNDRDRCYGIVPIGLAFVGNNEFALDTAKGKSVISAAVADRARHTETFEYANVEDDDIRLILRAHGITDELATAALIRRYSETARRPRSIRRLVEVDIPDIKLIAGERPVTLEIMREALAA